MGEDVTSGFAKTLRLIRAQRGLTQADLAEAVGISKAQVGHLETGRRQPTAAITKAVAAALGYTPSALVSGALIAAPASGQGNTTLAAWVRQAPVGLSLEAAEQVAFDQDAAEQLGDSVRLRLASLHEILGPDVHEIATLLHALVLDFASGRYRACRRETAVLCAAALTYLTTDEDAFPDHTHDAGHHDDIGVLVFVADLCATDLNAYEQWVTADPLD